MVTLFINGIQFLLEIIGAVVLFAVIVGGFMWLTSAGNSSRISQGKAIIVSAFTGLILFLSAYLIVNFVMATLLNVSTNDVQLFGNDWAEYCDGELEAFSCSAEGVGDGANCDSCASDGNCVCSGGSCVTVCQQSANLGDFNSATCVSTVADCSDGSIVSEASACDSSTPVCCLK